MHSQSSKTTEIGIQNETLLSKQKTFTRIKNKNKDTMIQLKGNNIPENNFKRTFIDCQNNLKDEVTSLNKQITEKQQEVKFLHQTSSPMILHNFSYTCPTFRLHH